ncbi:MAG: hypothetical protein LJE65_12455 [Desulfobacteraceae bacterium]|jgi:predicted transcriptional regulator|nr:hypothetical protein [Desulfobacteraceae bacterium]
MSEKSAKKEAMKRLREERKGWITKAAAAVKTQKKERKAILACLEKNPATVPEIAETTGIPSHRVIWFVAALKKYGELVEDGQDGSYFRYALVAPKETADEQACSAA